MVVLEDTNEYITGIIGMKVGCAEQRPDQAQLPPRRLAATESVVLECPYMAQKKPILFAHAPPT